MKKKRGGAESKSRLFLLCIKTEHSCFGFFVPDEIKHKVDQNQVGLFPGNGIDEEIYKAALQEKVRGKCKNTHRVGVSLKSRFH